MNSKSALIIRQSTNIDTQAIIDLVEKGLHEFGFRLEFNTSESDLIDIDKTYNKSGGLFLIATDKNQIIATGGILKISEGIYKIRKMYVDKAYRGKGIGKNILLELEQFAIKNNAKEVFLETTQMMKAAIALYKSFGFKMGSAVITSPRCEVSMKKTYNN